MRITRSHAHHIIHRTAGQHDIFRMRTMMIRWTQNLFATIIMLAKYIRLRGADGRDKAGRIVSFASKIAEMSFLTDAPHRRVQWDMGVLPRARRMRA